MVINPLFKNASIEASRFGPNYEKIQAEFQILKREIEIISEQSTPKSIVLSNIDSTLAEISKSLKNLIH